MENNDNEIMDEIDSEIKVQECIFEDEFVLVPITDGINIDKFSDFYISGLGFLCAKTPYMIILYDEYIDNTGTIKTKDIVGVIKKDNQAFIKIHLGA